MLSSKKLNSYLLNNGKMKNRALHVYFQPKIAERYEELEKDFPGIVELAISIKRIPQEYAENKFKPNSRLNDLLTKQLREKAGHYVNGKIKGYDLRFFMERARMRVDKFKKKHDDRKEICEMIEKSFYINDLEKIKILELLSA